MRDPSCFCDGLVAPEACPELANLHNVVSAAVATMMSWNGTRLGKGDCVLINDNLHVVQACVSLSDDLGLLTEQYARGEQALM